MAGVPGRSGGHNRLTAAEAKLRGSYRPDRHGPLPGAFPALVDRATVSAADRRRTLRGLSVEARRIAAALLTEYEGWDAAGLVTLRAYALSCERLEALQAKEATSELYREVRANATLLKLLTLERPTR